MLSFPSMLYSITLEDNFEKHFIFSKNQKILTEAHCSYFFIGFQAHLFSTSKKRITFARWGIHILGAKVLNFLELPEIIHFLHIYKIHILVSIFSSINGASRILNLNLILMVFSLL